MPAKSGNFNARKNKSANRQMWSGRLDKATLEAIKNLSIRLGLKSQGEVIDKAIEMFVIADNVGFSEDGE